MKPLASIHVIYVVATFMLARGDSFTQNFAPSSDEFLLASITSDQSQIQLYQITQLSLIQGFGALLAHNPTPQQIQVWQQQNTTVLASQQQLAFDLGAESTLEYLPLIGQPKYPTNASDDLKALLTALATLADARAQIHNQLLSAMPAEVSEDQVAQMQQREEQLFQQQQGTSLQILVRQAQTLNNQSAEQPLPLPPPLFIPLGSTPQIADYLIARDQLMRSKITFSNRYATASSAVRDAAMIQWMQQNTAQIQQVQAFAQNLSAVTSTTQN